MAKCDKCQTDYVDGVKCMCGGCESCSEGAPAWNCSDPSPFYGVNETGTGLDEPVIVQQGDDRFVAEYVSVSNPGGHIIPQLTTVTSVPYIGDCPPPPKPNHPRSEGPDYYRQKTHQPIDVIHDWKLPYEAANVVKYVARYQQKGGVKDLRKARHYLDLLIARLGDGDEPI